MGASESKLAFKHSIFELAGREDIPHNDPLWESFYTLPESADDVFSLWSPNDIASLTLSNREGRAPKQHEPSRNLETLLYVLITRLQTLQTKLLFPEDQRTTNIQILNCMRILTRIMPFIYEAKHLQDWHDRFFWQPRKPAYFWDKKRDAPGRLFDGLDPSKAYKMEEFDTVIGPPLGETLLEVVVKYFFFAGFTLPQRYDAEGNVELDTTIRVWTSGIGNSRQQPITKDNEKNQQETGRFLLALLSKTMYIQPNEVATYDVKPLTYMTTKVEKRAVNGILCSLLNTVLKYNPNVWSAPLDVASRTGEAKKLLVNTSLQLVLALTIYEPPVDAGKNQFRHALGSLHKPEDFQFTQLGISMTLQYPIQPSLTYSLSKEKSIAWAPEMMSLFWELVQCNKRFRRYLVDTARILDYLILLLYYAIDAKDDLPKHGVLRMCVFIIQTFSTEEKFAQKLNTEFRHPESLPAIMRVPNFHGHYADFLICSIHTLFTTTRARLESLYPALVTIIKNIAPHQMGLARATSSKLMSLVEMLATPEYLLANDAHKLVLNDLLATINIVIACHAAENRRFIEVLVASRNRFKALQDFNIDGALSELDRQAQQRKDRGEDVSSVQSPLSRNTSFDSVRGPPATHARTSSLGDVPENDRFAIGDDDEDGDDGEDEDETPTAVEGAGTASSTESPTSPRLSEKARGKQPAVSIASASRTTSTASLPSLASTHPTSTPQTSHFRPTHEWLDTWHPQLQAQLTPIFQIIEQAQKKQLKFHDVQPQQPSTPRPNADVPSTPAHEKQPTEPGRETRQSSQFARQSAEEFAAKTPRPDGEGHLRTQGDQTTPAAPTATGFQWTAVTIGWYTALIWSRIYLAESEAFQGSGGLYSSTQISLFKRSATSQEISLRSPKGAIDAVGNSLAQRISSISMK